MLTFWKKILDGALENKLTVFIGQMFVVFTFAWSPDEAFMKEQHRGFQARKWTRASAPWYDSLE